MRKTFSASRPIIALSIHIRTLILITLALALVILYSIQSLTPPQVYATSATAPAPPPAPVSSQRHHNLTSHMPACASDGALFAAGRAPTFLMVFMGHSGSTAIMTSLKQHSQTHILGFEPVDHGIYRSGKTTEHSLRALNYTKYFFANATKLGLTAGFKIRPPNIIARQSEFTHLLRQYRTRIIWSFRTNVFKQAISDYNIRYFGDTAGHEGFKIHNGTVHANHTRKNTIRINSMDNLHSLLKSRIRGEKEVEDALHAIKPDGCVLPVSYESYLRYPDVTLKRVQAFLGLDTLEIHPALRAKANTDTICDLVENWDQVCAAFFRCIQWRWMLDDFENGCSCASLRPSTFSDSRKYCTLT